jgi:cyclic lactone autoinducer peptide
MKSSKTMVVNSARIIAKLAEITAKSSNSLTCCFWYHQPKAPANLKEFCKK